MLYDCSMESCISTHADDTSSPRPRIQGDTIPTDHPTVYSCELAYSEAIRSLTGLCETALDGTSQAPLDSTGPGVAPTPKIFFAQEIERIVRRLQAVLEENQPASIATGENKFPLDNLTRETPTVDRACGRGAPSLTFEHPATDPAHASEDLLDQSTEESQSECRQGKGRQDADQIPMVWPVWSESFRAPSPIEVKSSVEAAIAERDRYWRQRIEVATATQTKLLNLQGWQSQNRRFTDMLEQEKSQRLKLESERDKLIEELRRKQKESEGLNKKITQLDTEVKSAMKIIQQFSELLRDKASSVCQYCRRSGTLPPLN